MEELIKILDDSLKYLRHEIDEHVIYIYVTSERDKVKCPFCGKETSKVHSRYKRTFQDLQIQGKKVIIVLFNRKMFVVIQNVSIQHLQNILIFCSIKLRKQID